MTGFSSFELFLPVSFSPLFASFCIRGARKVILGFSLGRRQQNRLAMMHFDTNHRCCSILAVWKPGRRPIASVERSRYPDTFRIARGCGLFARDRYVKVCTDR